MFTRFANMVLMFLAAAMVCVSVAIAVVKSNGSYGTFFGVLVVCILVSALILMMLGLIVEMGNNIMDMTEIMKKMSSQMSSSTDQTLEHKEGVFYSERKCPHCGELTSSKSEYCSKCGAKLS